MLWGIVTGTNVDYAELMWEEFIQAIKNFFFDLANLKVTIKKPKPPVIPYCRFTKVDDFPLNNLKFVSKGGVDEVFRMPIPKDLITDDIRSSEYYEKYLEMATRKPRQPTTMTSEEVGKKKKASKAGMSKQPAPAKQPKPAKKKTSKPTPLKKIRKGKKSDHLVDEEDEESQPASEPQVETGIITIFQRGNWEGIVFLMIKRTIDARFYPSQRSKDDTSVNVVNDTPSPIDSNNDVETATDMEQSNSEMNIEILIVDEEHGEEVSNIVALEERTVELDEGQAGSDPGKTPESQPQPELELMEEDQARSNPGQSHVAQAGPKPKPMHEDFIVTIYPEVHGSLKLTTEEQVHIENPTSSSETLSSMKNLEDEFTLGDQFLNDKSTEEETGKANMETEVKSMVTIPILQASSSVPLLSTPIIDLSPPKLVLPLVQEPIIIATTATTTTTTTLPPPPPPPPQSSTDPKLATHISALEKRSADFEQKNLLQDKTTQALASRVYKLENHDLYSKIDKQVKEVVK
ncbi:hypothetical protein Tco_1311215 [Tanacetum coccineum]